jgi:RNA-binding protein YhbY
MIEEIVQPGKLGVTNRQMIPAIKKAIAEISVVKLTLLKSTYLYTFENSLKEREYMAANLK